MSTASSFDCVVMLIVLTDNLAVSAQGFRRGANRVRKVCSSPCRLDVMIDTHNRLYRICGESHNISSVLQCSV